MRTLLRHGRRHTRGTRAGSLVLLVGMLALVLAGCASDAGGGSDNPVGLAVRVGTSARPTATPYDPSIGAPLPNNRIVAIYGIVGGVDFNGAASSLDMLNSHLSEFQQLGQQYASLDPIHPVKLGLDLVINTIQPCSAYPTYCASWIDDDTLQKYIDFCQQHDMLIFFDLQLGTEPVQHAVTEHLLKYLQKYPFVELALDTEFHFPNTPAGYADAAGYPCCLGWMNADEINWSINEMAQISLQNHLPRKVVVIHEWTTPVLPDKDKIQLNPNVSVVLQSDGWGFLGNKLGDYSVFVQQDLLQYGGYKIFLKWPDGSEFDQPQQSPADVMKLFPQPLFVSYQ